MSSHEELFSFESDRVVALEVFLRTCLLPFIGSSSSSSSSSPFKGACRGGSVVVGLSSVGRLVGLVREEEDSASEVGAERLIPFGGGKGGDESSTASDKKFGRGASNKGRNSPG